MATKFNCQTVQSHSGNNEELDRKVEAIMNALMKLDTIILNHNYLSNPQVQMSAVHNSDWRTTVICQITWWTNEAP